MAAQPARYPSVLDCRQLSGSRVSSGAVISVSADFALVDPGSASFIDFLKRRELDGDLVAPQLKEHVVDHQSLLVSPRVDHYDSNTKAGPLLSQFWVK